MYQALIDVLGYVPTNNIERYIVLAFACAFVFLCCYCLLKLVNWVTRF